jgi:hypothetical protein
MTHYIFFLKSLRSLEEFRKNPHIKIPSKSPCTNFQSLCKFKNPILFTKGISPGFRPNRPSSQLAHSAFWPSWPSWPPSSSSYTEAEHASHHRRPASCRPMVGPDHLHRREKVAASSLLHFPIKRVPSPLFNPPVTGTFKPGALKVLQRRPLKALGLPRLASVL